MDDSSEEEVIQKTEPKPFTIQLKPSLDNSSQNDDDDIYFSTNCLLKIKTDYKTSVPLSKKKKLFDSDDVDFKKNLFNSDNAQKSDLKKSSEVLSTEPTSFVVKNMNSPRKKYSVIKMVEKRKHRRDNDFFTHKIVETKDVSSDKKERRDFFGNVIKRKNKKKVKVSFIDVVTSQPLADVINIESFKNYNCIEGAPDEDGKPTNTECVCCLVF
jgi:hypothetical protein